MVTRASDATEPLSIERSGGAALSGLWSPAPEAVAVMALAHGAGAPMTHPLIAAISDGLRERGVTCLRFNFPYADAGRRAPDRAPVLLDAWQAALDAARSLARDLPVVAGGKSLGGRIASMLAAERGAEFPARGLVFFGYPLHAPGRPDRPRDEHLFDVRVPMLFIQGTADALARLDLIRDLVERLGGRATLHVVEGGDHSFRVRGTRRTPKAIGDDLAAVAATFVRRVIG